MMTPKCQSRRLFLDNLVQPKSIKRNKKILMLYLLGKQRKIPNIN